MTDFANWLLGIIKAAFTAIFDLITDVLIALLDLILKALLSILQALPAPSFANGGLDAALSAIPAEVWYFAGQLNLPACFTVLGAGFAFRMARKAATLFQW